MSKNMPTTDVPAICECLRQFDFRTLFREHLGWDNQKAQLNIPVDQKVFSVTAIAHKRGFVAYLCPVIPDSATRRKIDRQVTKSAHEHFIIYTDQPAGRQVWQWVRHEQGRPAASREYALSAPQSGEALAHRLVHLATTLQEEDELTIVGVTGKARAAFDVDKVTKKFFDRFTKEHDAFMGFIVGISAKADLKWYTSLTLNRLMFVYFMQKKGFLDGDRDYLKSRLARVRQSRGKDQFHSFYRYFLLRLFHDGLGKAPGQRPPDRAFEELLGRVPYLNGGFFEVHQLETKYPQIDIPDKAFETLFAFFDDYDWYLDERPTRSGKEINPDVVGYIFEKYINQKQMGAYYTKEDITEYISKNTIIPFLFDAAEKKCAIAFKPESALWRLLRDDPDRYIYAAVKHGVVTAGEVVPESALPDFVQAGMRDPNARMFDKRYNLGQAETDDNLRLVTETWREYIARRTRCLDIREKLRDGEIHQINELITLNLDIWQFARDAIINCEGPELLRAFWHAIEKLTVLDPTCGSGAFLFAALRILETLYSDCLERMRQFIDDLAGKKHHPEQFSDFKKLLAQVARHPNQRYFVFKAIIINNLFGVDIMEEAVEICKLRLFLKLAAQVETFEQIEPLPDIDFNIRAGNTLVGYASLDQVRKSQEGKLGFSDAIIQRIEEDAETVERAFQQFRAQQTTHGGKITPEDKQELRRRLEKLDDELDRYLAGEYGVKIEKQKDFDSWKASHQPFHWFIEFFGIMRGGGFDVIIGNPPYVEYAKVRAQYAIRNYTTENCGNLYAFMWERAISIAYHTATVGMIQPVAAVCTSGYEPLQMALRHGGGSIVSNFNDRPSKLFDGLEHIRLCIILLAKGASQRTFSTTYNKWQSVERPHLFQRQVFADATRHSIPGSSAKIGCVLESSILLKIWAERGLLTDYERSGRWPIYYTRKLSNFVQILDFVPTIRANNGDDREPSELKSIRFEAEEHRDVFLAILNSSLFYWLLTVYSDCRNLNRRDIGLARFDFRRADPSHVQLLVQLARSLMDNIRSNSKTLTMTYRDLGQLQIQCTYPRYSKPVIDDIDRALARHYGLTDEELDLIINYDIKYRMGVETENED